MVASVQLTVIEPESNGTLATARIRPAVAMQVQEAICLRVDDQYGPRPHGHQRSVANLTIGILPPGPYAAVDLNVKEPNFQTSVILTPARPDATKRP
jgi:hypothetical protein